MRNFAATKHDDALACFNAGTCLVQEVLTCQCGQEVQTMSASNCCKRSVQTVGATKHVVQAIDAAKHIVNPSIQCKQPYSASMQACKQQTNKPKNTGIKYLCRAEFSRQVNIKADNQKSPCLDPTLADLQHNRQLGRSTKRQLGRPISYSDGERQED